MGRIRQRTQGPTGLRRKDHNNRPPTATIHAVATQGLAAVTAGLAAPAPTAVDATPHATPPGPATLPASAPHPPAAPARGGNRAIPRGDPSASGPLSSCLRAPMSHDGNEQTAKRGCSRSDGPCRRAALPAAPRERGTGDQPINGSAGGDLRRCRPRRASTGPARAGRITSAQSEPDSSASLRLEPGTESHRWDLNP